jgi:hypothetical protein
LSGRRAKKSIALAVERLFFNAKRAKDAKRAKVIIPNARDARQ